MNKNEQLEKINKQIELDNILYSINEEEKTVAVIGYKKELDNFFVPRFIVYESNEYIVKSINQEAFKESSLKSIKFASDSMLQTIGDYAFNQAQIETITFPTSLEYIG